MPPYLFGKGTLAAALESFVSTTNGALSVLKANWPDGGELDLSKYSETLLPDEADHLKRFLQQADNEDKDAGPKLSELVRTGLRSALCLAVGVDPGGKMPTRLPAGRGQPWPVEIFWGCGAAANQFWLSSRPQPADPSRGQVTLILQFEVEPQADSDMTVRRSSAPAPVPGAHQVLVYRRRREGSGVWFEPGREQTIYLGGLPPRPAVKAVKRAAKASAAKKAPTKASKAAARKTAKKATTKTQPGTKKGAKRGAPTKNRR